MSSDLTIETRPEGDIFLHTVMRGMKIIEYRSLFRHLSEREIDYLHWLIDKKWGKDEENENV